MQLFQEVFLFFLALLGSVLESRDTFAKQIHGGFEQAAGCIVGKVLSLIPYVEQRPGNIQREERAFLPTNQ